MVRCQYRKIMLLQKLKIVKNLQESKSLILRIVQAFLTDHVKRLRDFKFLQAPHFLHVLSSYLETKLSRSWISWPLGSLSTCELYVWVFLCLVCQCFLRQHPSCLLWSRWSTSCSWWLLHYTQICLVIRVTDILLMYP